MLKKLFVVAALVAVGSMVGVSTVSAKQHDNDNEDKVTICHRTNSVVNPYNKISVSKSAVDGQGNNDHTQHTGPVASSVVVALYLKSHHIKWGDIIPPFDSYPGYNWTTKGQAVYDNNCNYPEHQVPTPDIDFAVVCDVANHKAVVTFTNTGNAAGSASVNGAVVAVPLAGAVYDVPTAISGTQVKIVINDVTVYDQLVTCEPGKGAGETPTTPAAPATPVAATPAASLPFTGDNTPVIALVASAIAAVTAIVSVIAKSALVKQL